MYELMLELCKFNLRKVLLCIGLVLVLSIFEGVSIAAILPIISLTNASHNQYSSQLLSLINKIGIHHLEIIPALVIFIVLVTSTSILQRYRTIVIVELQQGFNSYLVTKLYNSLAITSWKFWLNKTRADITNTVNNDISRITTGCYFLFQLLTHTLLLIIYGTISFMVSTKLTLLILATSGMVFLTFRFLVKKSRNIGLAITTFNQHLMFKLTEYLNGMKEIKCYGLEQQQLTQLINTRKAIERSYMNFTRSQSLLDLIYKVASAIFISLIFYIALTILHLNSLDLILIVVIFARTWPKIASIQTALQSISMSLPAFEQIIKLKNEAWCNSIASSIKTPTLASQISFTSIIIKNLSFSYLNTADQTIKNINFKIASGSFTACIGKSGSGKSTLADLLLGLLTPSSGEIIISGHPIITSKNLAISNMQEWKTLVSYVPQDIFLFNASIRENLCWSGTNIDDKEIWEILKVVQLYKLVDALPNNLDSLVGDRGIQLSGGERQRLVLARALLRKPQFLVLDEATSSLDQQNETLIQQTIEQLHGKLTIFVIAHRLSTIKHADQILILDKGNLIGQGTYSELSKSHQSYFTT